MCKMLLSINPEHVENILAGTKRYEFRKRRCREEVSSILIYCTSPVMKVVAEADIEEILEDTVREIWRETKDLGGISFSFYKEYYKGKETAVAYKLTNVRKFDEPMELSHYGVKCAPQSFVYITENF